MQQFSSCFDRGDAVAKGRMRARLGAWRRHHGRSREPAPTFPDQMKGEDSRTATRTPPRARCGWKIEAFHKILKSGVQGRGIPALHGGPAHEPGRRLERVVHDMPLNVLRGAGRGV